MSKAGKASEETKKADAEERINLEVVGSYDNSGYINLTDLNNNLKNNLENLLYNGEKISETNKIRKLPATVSYNGIDVEITGKTISYLVDEVEIGDYVDIGIDYSAEYENNYAFNSDVYNNGYTKTDSALTGWRVLSKTGSGSTGTVKLISAGCPLSYFYGMNLSTEKVILDLDNLEKTIEFVGDSEIGFKGCGFNTTDLKSLFDKNYIDSVHAFSCSTNFRDGEGPKGENPLNEVEELYYYMTGENETMAELDFQYSLSTSFLINKVGIDNWKEKCTDLFCIGQSYYLGGATFGPTIAWKISLDGGVSGEAKLLAGVRPVVCLAQGVKMVNENGKDGCTLNTAYNIVK